MYINAEEYLDQIRKTRHLIDLKTKALHDLDYMIEAPGISYDKEIISTSPRQDGLERMAMAHLEKIAELKEERLRYIRQLKSEIDEAVGFISQIESKEQREVLMMRYIEDKDWSAILEARACDDLRSQYKLHERAIESLQKVLNNHLMTTP